MKITFDEVSIKGTKKFKCACGRHCTRTKKFYQTLNPFNRVEYQLNGATLLRPKTVLEIQNELYAEREKWLHTEDPCTHE